MERAKDNNSSGPVLRDEKLTPQGRQTQETQQTQQTI